MKTLVIAPHPDDELIGAGGLILKRKLEGREVAWVIMTEMKKEKGFSESDIDRRKNEIVKVKDEMQFDQVFELHYPTRELDTIPLLEITDNISGIFSEFQPNEVLIPSPSDIHSDHRVTYDISVSCSKWFRHPYIERILAYETLSETNFDYLQVNKFHPNFFVDISNHIERKIELIKIYESEFSNHPFPRSVEALRALAVLRGSVSGFKAAEAYQLMLDRS